MGDISFIFNKIKGKDITFFLKDANVFNMALEDIKKEKIELVSFSDETLGSAEEKLDIAVYTGDKWELVDIDDKVKGYNEIPLDYILPDDKEFTRILIIVRRMSNMLLDRINNGHSSYIYCVARDKYKGISEDKALFGLLAKSKVYLDVSDEEIRKQIQENVIDKNNELLSKLFS